MSKLLIAILVTSSFLAGCVSMTEGGNNHFAEDAAAAIGGGVKPNDITITGVVKTYMGSTYYATLKSGGQYSCTALSGFATFGAAKGPQCARVQAGGPFH